MLAVARDDGHLRWRLGWLLDVAAQLQRVRVALTLAVPHDARLLRAMARDLRDARRCVRAQVGFGADLQFLRGLAAVGPQWAEPMARWLRGEPAGRLRLHAGERLALEVGVRRELGLPNAQAAPASGRDAPPDSGTAEADPTEQDGGTGEPVASGGPVALGRARDLGLALHRAGVARRLGQASGFRMVPALAAARRGGGYVWLHLRGTCARMDRLLAFCRVRLVAWGQPLGLCPVGP